MPLTYFLAQVLGITFTTAALTLLLERKMMREVIKGLIENRALIYVLGIFDLIFGLMIVLSHNIWRGNSLMLVVTLMGWLLLIKGVLRMTLPSRVIKKLYTKYYTPKFFYCVGILILGLGAYLTYEGFAPFFIYHYY
jgi:hypothetical protein